MLKILRDLWAQNEHQLQEAIGKLDHFPDYEELVKITFQNIYNQGPVEEYEYRCLNVDKITVIDDGDYQGTMLFVIPFDAYQPDPRQYLITHVYYGSCSYCDTLEHIRMMYDVPMAASGIKELTNVCKDIITNTVKPYNHGWRHIDLFDHVEFEEEE